MKRLIWFDHMSGAISSWTRGSLVLALPLTRVHILPLYKWATFNKPSPYHDSVSTAYPGRTSQLKALEIYLKLFSDYFCFHWNCAKRTFCSAQLFYFSACIHKSLYRKLPQNSDWDGQTGRARGVFLYSVGRREAFNSKIKLYALNVAITSPTSQHLPAP